MFSRFFIDRPIFASVVSLLIVLAGVVAMNNLSVAQYPDLTPPTIEVSAMYPGASAEVVSETVSSLLEQKINGTEDVIYMSSVASSIGTSVTQVFFAVGTDPNQAMINVNNRVQSAASKLPEEVRRYGGVTVQKKSSAILQVLSLFSDDPRYDAVYLGNYAVVNLVDELKRLEGVGDAVVMTANEYAMRIWLKPDRLAKLGVTVSDVVAAISAQNAQRAAGKIGAQPMSLKVDRSYSIVAHGRFMYPEQFKEIIIRSNPNGTSLKLKDVANVELGGQSYDVCSKTKGMDAIPLMISLSPGANSMSTVKLITAKMEELSKRFPKGIEYKVAFDTSKFVKESIKGVVQTLFEAILLVFIVVFLFLKNWRATLIPSVVMPISIIGTFAGMLLLGFSINTLTLFGLVLAIGIVVDDAIVVIENVERIMKAELLPAREATIKAMEEVTGALVSIVLVLCAVFVPVSFMGGFAGAMYKQFAITIAISVVISGIVALTLTPALCVVLLKNHQHQQEHWFFVAFDRFFDKLTNAYTSAVAFFIAYKKTAFLCIAGVAGLTFFLLQITPKSLLPFEDQGVCLVSATLDPASSLDRSLDTISKVDKLISKDPAVIDSLAIAGYNMLSATVATNGATMFVKLDEWDKRTAPGTSSQDIVKKIMGIGAGIADGRVLAFCPPPIVGISTTGGFEGSVQRVAGIDSRALESKMKEFVAAASKRPELTGVTSTFNASTPQFLMEVDEVKAIAFDVRLSEIYDTVAATFGSYYVNDFSKFGKSFKVMIQAAEEYRSHPDRINEIYVRSLAGAMIPMSAFVKFKPIVGPDSVERFNCFPSAKFLGNPAAGYTSGEAITAIEEVADSVLGNDYLLAWTGSAYQEKISGESSTQALILGLVVVFLILAAQYERWTLPLSIIAAVPFAVFGAILAIFLRELSNDIYFQIALVMLVGLSAKNAILIVEFANILKHQGESIVSAAVKAAQMRFRPIVMTSLAFICGCLPLAVSTGAGSASRHSIGTAVIGGMIGATVFAPLFIPLFYVLITTMSDKIRGKS